MLSVMDNVTNRRFLPSSTVVTLNLDTLLLLNYRTTQTHSPASAVACSYYYFLPVSEINTTNRTSSVEDMAVTHPPCSF